MDASTMETYYMIKVSSQITGEKDGLFKKWGWVKGSHLEKHKGESYLTPYITINSKWLKHLNVKQKQTKNIQVLEESTDTQEAFLVMIQIQ